MVIQLVPEITKRALPQQPLMSIQGQIADGFETTLLALIDQACNGPDLGEN